MSTSHSFKFLDDELHRALVGRLREAGVDHVVDEDGVVHYSDRDREFVENDLIRSIRDVAFPTWQVVTCPPGWVARYREYMGRRRIPYREELSDGEPWFLIPRSHRPHSWKLDHPSTTGKPARIEG